MSETEQVAAVERRLTAEFADLPEGEVVAAVRRAHSGFAVSTVRDFVPLLVERRARRELTALHSDSLAPTG